MARPKGHTLNPDAFEDWLTARGMTRTDVAEATGVALNTLSGLTRSVDPHGASTKTAYRIAQALRVRPGSLFPALVGHVAPVPHAAVHYRGQDADGVDHEGTSAERPDDLLGRLMADGWLSLVICETDANGQAVAGITPASASHVRRAWSSISPQVGAA